MTTRHTIRLRLGAARDDCEHEFNLPPAGMPPSTRPATARR